MLVAHINQKQKIKHKELTKILDGGRTLSYFVIRELDMKTCYAEKVWAKKRIKRVQMVVIMNMSVPSALFLTPSSHSSSHGQTSSLLSL